MERPKTRRKVKAGRALKSGVRAAAARAAKPIRKRAGIKAADTLLLHELRVYQEELEAQNAQLRQTQAELASALARYTDLYDFAPVGLLTITTDGSILDANATAAAIFGMTRAHLIHASIRTLVAISHLSAVEAMLRSPVRREQRRHLEVRLCDDRVGGERHVQVIAARSKDRIQLTIVDVTEVRRLEKAVAQASQLERDRLRADLHDGLGQELTGLSLALAALRVEGTALGLPWAEKLEQLRIISSKAIMSCRTIVHGLSPVAKSGGGLLAALESLAKRSRRDGDPAIEISVMERFPLILEESVAEHIYRIAQETINNALKHGQPTVIRVDVMVLQKTLTVEIHDNGARHRAAPTAISGHGLDVMRFRARKIHGKLAILRSDRGTRVRCSCRTAPRLLRRWQADAGRCATSREFQVVRPSSL